MKEIHFTTQISEKDFIRFNYHAYFSRWVAKLLLISTPFFVYTTIFAFVEKLDNNSKWVMLFISVIGVYAPILVYFASKKAYKTQPILHEQISYEINEEIITSKGATFKSSQSWSNIVSVSETKSLILIWQSARTAKVISKKSLTFEQIETLKYIVSLHSNVKNKLKS